MAEVLAEVEDELEKDAEEKEELKVLEVADKELELSEETKEELDTLTEFDEVLELLIEADNELVLLIESEEELEPLSVAEEELVVLAESVEELDALAELEEELEMLAGSEEELKVEELDALSELTEELEILAILVEIVAAADEDEVEMLVGIDDDLDSVRIVDEELATLDNEVTGADTDEDDEDKTGAVMNLYIVSLFGPPQIWVALPLQGMLHCVFPSGAGPPPLSRVLPQSSVVRLDPHDREESKVLRTAFPAVFSA
jgi:hypothetical protein